MGSEYINENVLRAINLLIGENTPENFERLKNAALRVRMGVQPISRPLLSKSTSYHLGILESSEDFEELKEHLAGYIMSSQRDEGERTVRSSES